MSKPLMARATAVWLVDNTQEDPQRLGPFLVAWPFWCFFTGSP